MRESFLKELVPNIEAIALRYFRGQSLETENKRVDAFDPVTLADKEIETVFREAVEKSFPDDAVMGEEFASRGGGSGFEWTIDPIDGTRAFVIGAPCFTILIALEGEDGFVSGLISQPFTGERFWRLGGEAFLEKQGEERRVLRTSQTQTLNDALMATTFPEIGTQDERIAFGHVNSAVKMTRYGMDAYAFGLLALGQLDLVIEAGLKPYDYRAPWAVIEAAGGVFINWEGKPPSGDDRVIAAANWALAEAALEKING